MRSSLSTATPATCPRIQFSGSGFGQYGSTAKRGMPVGALLSPRDAPGCAPGCSQPAINAAASAAAPRMARPGSGRVRTRMRSPSSEKLQPAGLLREDVVPAHIARFFSAQRNSSQQHALAPRTPRVMHRMFSATVDNVGADCRPRAPERIHSVAYRDSRGRKTRTLERDDRPGATPVRFTARDAFASATLRWRRATRSAVSTAPSGSA